MKKHYLAAAIIYTISFASLVKGQASEEAPAEPALGPVSGSFSLDINSHHMSYGRDIWGAGSGFNDAQINPSLGLNFDLGNDVTLNVGVWAEINDNVPAIALDGNKFQEVDFWVGIGFGLGDIDVSLTYQEWVYVSDSERIFDIGIGPFDLPFNPSIKFHCRLDEGAAGDTSGPTAGTAHDTGVVTVINALLPGFSIGGLDFAIPVNVAFATDGYHGGDSGYAYSSIGLTTSAPLTGPWTLNAGLTYYLTDDKVIPSAAGNEDDNILTGSVGIGMSF